MREKIGRYEKVVEISTWAIIIAIIFGINFFPQKPVDEATSYYLVGTIISFALIYYLLIYKYFPRNKRLYIKDIADIVLIGSLIIIMKDWGQYFYALFFLPIAAAALSLEFINALLIATIASLFVVFELFLGSQGLYPKSGEIYQGAWQIGLILIITVFCRVLAIQLRQEKIAKEESLAYQEVLKEESRRQKEFMSLTSHQLFTPLSMIRGHASNLNSGALGKLAPKQQEAIDEIYLSSKRMVGLISELLSISRLQSGKIPLHPKPCQIENLVQEVIGEFEKLIPGKIKIEFSKKTLKPVNCDGEKIRLVLYNLLDNAVKYSASKPIEITLNQTAERTAVSIIDRGAGLRPEEFAQLFQPFFRGENILELDNKGTGLGLYISRLIIEEHKGKIWAKSSGPQKGATFSFDLPN